MFGSVGTTEILLILGVFCLIFGPSLVRGFGRKLGENIRESKKALGEIKEAMKEPKPEEPPKS